RLVLPALPVELLVLGRRQVGGRAVQPLGVPPLDPFACLQLDVCCPLPGPAALDQLRFEQAVHRLGQGVVVRITFGADRADDAGLGQSLGVANGQVLDSAVGVTTLED